MVLEHFDLVFPYIKITRSFRFLQNFMGLYGKERKASNSLIYRVIIIQLSGSSMQFPIKMQSIPFVIVYRKSRISTSFIKYSP